jgi:hypothetical protein
MLDVHPSHESAHTWRDFFIHIATIVVGLLIAVAIEQTIEFFHHRHQVSEARESLHVEQEENLWRYKKNTTQVRLNSDQFQNDLLVLLYLKQHPGTPQEKLPGILLYGVQHAPAQTAAWKTTQRTGVTELLPRDEVARYDASYEFLAMSDQRADKIWATANQALQYHSLGPDPSRFTSDQLEDQIKLTQDLVTANVYWGYALQNLHREDPVFGPGPSAAELTAMRGPVQAPEATQALSEAISLTNGRLKKQMEIQKAIFDAYDAAHKLPKDH